MPPYSHAAVGAVQILTPAVPTPTNAKKLVLLRRSESSSSFSETDGSAPRKINRWQQLRRMVFQLTGLGERDCVSDGSPTIGTRRRPHSLGGGSPILMLHHDFWLEAIDEKHRYGFHLRAFHALWKQEVDQLELDHRNRSFFYWLDHGRGSSLELPNCDRDSLNATQVQYCSLQQRREFEVEFTLARLVFAERHEPVQTDALSKWIFVLSQDDKLYIARKNKGYFHHSSFLAGVPVVAAGKIYVSEGKIYAIEPHSGHFKPKLGSLTALCCVLRARGVDVANVRFIKPKKWNDPWPFEAVDEDKCTSASCPGDDYVSDSEDSSEKVHFCS